jgi:SsrA-binding protein
MARAAEGERTIVSNRRAFHEYHVEERFEAGLALVGSEVKSLRAGHVSLGEAYATVRDDEVWLVNASIEPYAQASVRGHERRRERKLLLHKREIARIRQRTDERGYTVIPLRMYFKNGRVKVEIGLGRGKDIGDKRQAMAERDAKRDIDRALRDAEKG